MSREPIGKKLRFEVFKRDSFTCQYCGKKAPDVVLHCDHIHPVAEGGKTELLNLITSCEPCNLGKGARKLDDRSVVERQKAQLDELQARREQIEMMLQWRDALEGDSLDIVEEISRRIGEKGYYEPNAAGRANIRKWVRRYGASHVMEAADRAMESYLVWRAKRPNKGTWRLAFAKIPTIANLLKQAETKPYMPKLAYIGGIIKRRLGTPHENYIEGLEYAHVRHGAPLDLLEEKAKGNYSDMIEYATSVLEAMQARGIEIKGLFDK